MSGRSRYVPGQKGVRGEPLFGYGDTVKFELILQGNDKPSILTGTVEIIDPRGSLGMDQPSYDVRAKINGEYHLIKHIAESDFLEHIPLEPILRTSLREENGRTVTELRLFSTDEDAVAFEIWPVTGDIERWETVKRLDSLAVFETDFRRLLTGFFSRLYPLLEPVIGEPDKFSFIEWDRPNLIGEKDWSRLIRLFELNIPRMSEDIRGWFELLLEFCRSCLDVSSIVCVEGKYDPH